MAKKQPIVIDPRIPFNSEQERIRAAITDPDAKYILAIAGTGLGKTFAILQHVFERALVAPKSRHLCMRSKVNDAKTTLFENTAKDVIEAMFGEGTWEEWRSNNERGRNPSISMSPPRITFENESFVLFKGFDANNPDRSLGADFITIFISEVSEWHDMAHVNQLETRLRQKVTTIFGKTMRPKFLFDCNPPSRRHWTFPAFSELVDPKSGVPHYKPEQWRHVKGDVEANAENLAPGYLEGIRERNRHDPIAYARFVKGDWYNEVDNPLFRIDDIAKARVLSITPGQAADRFKTIVVAVDPAGSHDPNSDETGIIVFGVDGDDPNTCEGFVLADLSGIYQPHEWASVATEAYREWQANWVVAEKNFGGDMVVSTLRTIDRSLSVIVTTSSRGKEVRAEPASTTYRQHRVHHAGEFPHLEGQMLEYGLNYNRKTRKSPDRMDALVFAINFLMVSEQKRRGGSYKIADGIW